MSVKVSIVLPYYNTPPQRFDRCIKSVMSQTYKDIQIIIVDDGSNEDSATYLDSYQKIDNRIIIIHKKNEGSAIARNTGLNMATGDYSMFVDSDDYLFPCSVEDAVKQAEVSNADIIIGLVKKFPPDADNFIENVNDEKSIRCISIENAVDFDSLMDHILGYQCKKFIFELGYVADGPVAKLFKTSLGQSAPFSREPYYSDDTIWNIKILRQCKKVIICGRVWYGYVVLNGSKTRGYRPNCPEEYKYRVKQQKELCEKMWPRCKKGMARTIRRNTEILCRTFLFHPQNKMNEKEKASVFIDCTGIDEYKWAMRNVDFKDEMHILKRFAKCLDKAFILSGLRVGSYYIWKVFTGRLRKKEGW